MLTTSSVHAKTEYNFSVGDKFSFVFSSSDELKINGTDYSETPVKNKVDIEVTDVIENSTGVFIVEKDTQEDQEAESTSQIDTWPFLFALPIFVYGISIFVQALVSLYPSGMDFEAPEVTSDISTTETTSDNSSDSLFDFDLGVFVSANDTYYEEFTKDSEFGDAMTGTYEKGILKLNFDNSSKIDGTDEGKDWYHEIALKMDVEVDTNKGIMTNFEFSLTLDKKYGDAESLSVSTFSISEDNGILGFFGDLPGLEFFVAMISLISITAIYRRKSHSSMK